MICCMFRPALTPNSALGAVESEPVSNCALPCNENSDTVRNVSSSFCLKICVFYFSFNGICMINTLGLSVSANSAIFW